MVEDRILIALQARCQVEPTALFKTVAELSVVIPISFTAIIPLFEVSNGSVTKIQMLRRDNRR